LLDTIICIDSGDCLLHVVQADCALHGGTVPEKVFLFVVRGHQNQTALAINARPRPGSCRQAEGIPELPEDHQLSFEGERHGGHLVTRRSRLSR
jgi:hypothetical protein